MLQEALADYTMVTQLQPNAAWAFEYRASVYEALGKKEEAIADFRKALSINAALQTSKDGLRRLGVAP